MLSAVQYIKLSVVFSNGTPVLPKLKFTPFPTPMMMVKFVKNSFCVARRVKPTH